LSGKTCPCAWDSVGSPGLTNGFSKKLDNHVAAVALYVAHYNLCRVHEALGTTPSKAAGIADRAWTMHALKLRGDFRRAPEFPDE
jgi:hypothetical protein